MGVPFTEPPSSLERTLEVVMRPILVAQNCAAGDWDSVPAAYLQRVRGALHGLLGLRRTMAAYGDRPLPTRPGFNERVMEILATVEEMLGRRVGPLRFVAPPEGKTLEEIEGDVDARASALGTLEHQLDSGAMDAYTSEGRQTMERMCWELRFRHDASLDWLEVARSW